MYNDVALIVITLLIMGLIVPCCLVIVTFCRYFQTKRVGLAEITFAAFRSFYDLDQNSWTLGDNYVALREAESIYQERNRAYNQRICCNILNCEHKYVSYVFKTYFDCVKYQRWNKKRKRQKRIQEIEERKAADIAWLIEQVQSNINDMSQRAESEMTEAATMAIKAVRPIEKQ